MEERSFRASDLLLFWRDMVLCSYIVVAREMRSFASWEARETQRDMSRERSLSHAMILSLDLLWAMRRVRVLICRSSS